MNKGILVACGLLIPARALGWGFDGHRRLTQMLGEPLPAGSCIRQWVTGVQGAALQNASVEPDRWREPSNAAYDPEEAPRHFLEVDWADPTYSYPREWEAVQAQFGRHAVGNGQVPWRVEALYGRLVQAFREGNDDEAALQLAYLSHYVTDAFSILHATKNFDPDGLHQRWESRMLESRTRLDALSSDTRRHFGKVGRAMPRDAAFDAVLVGNSLLPSLLEADAAARDANGAPDVVALFDRTRDLTARRWGDALTVLASLLANAWMDAGRPRLSGMGASCLSDSLNEPMTLVGHPPPEWPETRAPPASTDGGASTPQPPAPGAEVRLGRATTQGPTAGCSAFAGPGAGFLWAAAWVALRASRRRGRAV